MHRECPAPADPGLLGAGKESWVSLRCPGCPLPVTCRGDTAHLPGACLVSLLGGLGMVGASWVISPSMREQND